MELQQMNALRERQREYFLTGATKPLSFRLKMLKTLNQAVAKHEESLMQALKRDLGKPAFEAYGGEIGILYEELKHIRKDLKAWAKPQWVPTPIANFPSESHVISEPLGSVLIIAPWNYPLQLLLSPLLGAMAAGNCSVLKPSELAPATSKAVAELIEDTFDPRYIACVEGDVEVNKRLLEVEWDHIFFTGSTPVGKIIMAAASKHLTPVTLELGGKSPCLVDRNVPIATTARRIVWGKFFNAGQTCVAPDYLLVHENDKDALVTSMQKAIADFFGNEPKQSPDYGRIINDRHFSRLSGLMEKGKKLTGGTIDPSSRYMAPTLIDGVSWEDPIMQEEIFGPLLPIMTYSNLTDVVSKLQRLPKPLAFYFFSKSSNRQKEILDKLSFGGGCINDTLVHLSNPNMPFGGVGPSGMGRYHGKYSFDAFSHKKSVLNKSFKVDVPLRYQPYKNKVNLLKRLFGP